MRYRKLDSNLDMTFGNNQHDFHVDNPEAVAQAVLTKLKLWTGEWFVDVTEGTNYPGGVLGKYTKEIVEPVIRARILSTEGVTSIDEFSLAIDADSRQTSINATITTEYGQTTIAGIM